MKIYDVVNMGLKDVVLTPTTSSIIKPPGIYDGKVIVQGDSNLIAANILSGKSIFGVAGNITARQYASGSVTSGSTTYSLTNQANGNVSMYLITVSGLTFTPNIILAVNQNTNGYTLYNSYETMDKADSNPGKIAVMTTGPYFNIQTNVYVNSTGFQLPVSGMSYLFNWYAFG